MARLLDDLQILSPRPACSGSTVSGLDLVALAQDTTAAFRARADRAGSGWPVALPLPARGRRRPGPDRRGAGQPSSPTPSGTPPGRVGGGGGRAGRAGSPSPWPTAGPIDARERPSRPDRFAKSADSGGRAGAGHRQSLVQAHGGQITAESAPGRAPPCDSCSRLWKAHRFVGVTAYPCPAPLRACSIEGDVTGIPTEADGWVVW